MRISVGSHAALEWLPQETLFYRAADVTLTHDVQLDAGARYLGSEILCLGRTASGERFDAGLIRQSTSIRRDEVMDGLPEMIPDVQVEATFPDGSKLVTVHQPII